MLTLLSDQLAPVTSAIGFLRLPLPAATEALVGWRRRLHGSAGARAVTGDLRALVRDLEPLTSRVRPRELLVSTADDSWTAYFDCGIAGGDPVTAMGFLARDTSCHAVVARSVPHTIGTSLERPGRYGAIQFELYGPLQTEFLNYVRTVAVTHDGSRWRFDANGTVQDFEQTDAYTAHRVRDRFTSHMLADYCAALGLHPFDASFYQETAMIIETPVTVPRAAKVLSLRETQRWLGIAPGASDQVPG